MKKCKSNRDKSNTTNANGNNSHNSNNNSNSNSNSNSTITDEEKNQLIKQIGITNLSEFGIILIIYASILNILYLEWQKVKISDQLNSTNYADTLQDLTEVPKGTNIIYLFVIAICKFIFNVVYDNYKTALSQTGENRDEKKIRDTYKNFIAILLILLGTTMNFEVLNC